MRWEWSSPQQVKRWVFQRPQGGGCTEALPAANAAVPWSSGPQSFWHRGARFLEDNFFMGWGALCGGA